MAMLEGGGGYKGLLITTINITENGETATEARVYLIKQDRSAPGNPQAFWSPGGSVLLGTVKRYFVSI